MGLAVRAPGEAGPAATAVTEGGLPAGWRAMKEIDAHNHVFAPVQPPEADWSEVEAMIEAAGVLGSERLLCSKPITAGGGGEDRDNTRGQRRGAGGHETLSRPHRQVLLCAAGQGGRRRWTKSNDISRRA